MYMHDTTHAYQYILYKSYSPIHLPEDLGMAFSHAEPPQKWLSFISELEKLKNVARILPDRF